MTTVLFVGDSITVGLVGVAQKKTNGASFRGPASAALGWRAVGPFIDPTGLAHGGVGGSTTHTFLNGTAQFVADEGGSGPDATHSWVLKYNPDVIHIMLGVNDIFSFKEDPLKIFDRLYQLASAAVWQQKRNGKRGNVLVSTICQSMFPEQVSRAKVLNAKIADFREVGADYSIVGVSSAAKFNAAISKDGVKNYTVDGTHPNQAGYNLIAASLADSLGATSRRGVNASSASSGAKAVVAAGLGFAAYLTGREFRWW